MSEASHGERERASPNRGEICSGIYIQGVKRFSADVAERRGKRELTDGEGSLSRGGCGLYRVGKVR